MRIAITLALVAATALALVCVVVLLVKGPAEVLSALGSLLNGIAGSPTAIGATGKTLTPILLIGTASCLSFRAGQFDVGQLGQFVLGGVFAGAIAPIVAAPGPIVIVVALAAGALAGGLWSLLISRASLVAGVQLVVMSLIANYLAEGLGRMVTRTLFQDHNTYSVIATQTISEQAWLPILLPRTNFHSGIIFAFALIGLAFVVVKGTVLGHRLTMFGLNPVAAALSGVDARGFQSRLQAATGAICGLAGAIEVMGHFHRYQDASLGGANSVAWTGVIAAILVSGRVLAVLPAALLLAALTTGFAGIQRDLGIPSGLGVLMAGLVVITAAFMAKGGGNRVRPSSGRAHGKQSANSDEGNGQSSAGEIAPAKQQALESGNVSR
ncbi:ABC transporter permease (plasmid) [Rhizobium sullae]|uniref:ABC transporter permease n=1 Tax=Rhizobium sullae TaxID=50338 RepID=A0ABY5XY53_RHISU|nr:ABC transporter permease [Rhizobium sullae]UWU19481.1 ABC transporter permease [Rhizobium sullae]